MKKGFYNPSKTDGFSPFLSDKYYSKEMKKRNFGARRSILVSEIPEIVDDLDKQEAVLSLDENAREAGIAGKITYSNKMGNDGVAETKRGKDAAEVMYV
ncbi:MAG: hypothetical protein WA139_03990 [Candidatus Aenigmatarchaeota archaeon]